MNHTRLVTIVSRLSMVWMCVISATISHGMANNLENEEFTYESYPLLIQPFKDLIANDEADPRDFQKIFDDKAEWSMHNGDRVNNACGRACIAAWNGDHATARQLFAQGAKQGSFWAMQECGLYELCDFNISNASAYFQKAYSHDSYKIAKDRGLRDKDAVRAHQHIMAMLGFAGSKKKNFLSTLDQLIIQASGKKMEDLAYPLAVCAQDVGDTYARDLCLDKAGDASNKFSKEISQMRQELNAVLERSVSPVTPAAAIEGNRKNEHLEPLATHTVHQSEEKTTIAIDYSSPQSHASMMDTSAFDSVGELAQSPSVEPSNIQLNPYKKLSDKELQRARAVNQARLRASTDDSEARIERFLIDEARLLKAKNDSQRIPILRDMAAYFHPDACYQLSEHYASKQTLSETEKKQRWTLLKHAADKNHTEACYRFIFDGLSSADEGIKKEAATYAERLFDDPMRMTQVAFSANQQAKAYCEYGNYCAKNGLEQKAIDFLQRAVDQGENTYIYTLAELYEKRGIFSKAQELYGCVESDKKAQAAWNRAILKYGGVKNPEERIGLLQEWSKQCMPNVTNMLPHDEIALRLKNQRVQDQLRQDAEHGSAIASYVLAFCVQHNLVENDNTTAFQYCVQSLELAQANHDNACREASIIMLRKVAEDGDQKAEGYLRKYYPTQDQQELDQLYRNQNFDEKKTLTPTVFTALEKDVQSDDAKIAFYACIQSGIQYLRKGDDAKLKKQKQKASEFYNKALQFFTQVMRPHDDQSPQYTANIRALLTKAYVRCAELQSNLDLQKDYYQRAADDDMSPNPNACIWMYTTTKEEKYLMKAIECSDPEALIIKAEKCFSDKQDVTDQIEKLLDMEASLSNELKVRLYRLKIDLTSDESEQRKFYSKAFDAGCYEWAFEVAGDKLKSKNYAEALAAIKKVRRESSNMHYVGVMQSYIEHLLSPNDAKKKQAVFKECACLLRGILNGPINGKTAAMVGDIMANIEPSATARSDQEIEALMLTECMKGDYQHVVTLLNKVKNIEKSSVALSVLATLIDKKVEGIPTGYQETCFLTALKGLALEECAQCRHHARIQVSKLLDWHAYGFQVDKSMSEMSRKIFNRCIEDGEGNVEALRIKNQVGGGLAACAYADQDTAELVRVYRHLDTKSDQYHFCRALLLDCNKLPEGEKLSDVKAAVEAFKIYQKFADEGDVQAQRVLTWRHYYGAHLPSGLIVEKNLMRAEEYALKLVDNPRATVEAKAVAHEVLANLTIKILDGKIQAFESMKRVQELGHNPGDIASYPAEIKTAYDFCASQSAAALKGGHYGALAIRIELCHVMAQHAKRMGKMDEQKKYMDDAESWYMEYVENEKLWERSDAAASFAHIVITTLPHHMRDLFIEHFLPKCLGTMMIEDVEKLRELVVAVDRIVKNDTKSYSKYGFDTEKEMILFKDTFMSVVAKCGKERCVVQ